MLLSKQDIYLIRWDGFCYRILNKILSYFLEGNKIDIKYCGRGRLGKFIYILLEIIKDLDRVVYRK